VCGIPRSSHRRKPTIIDLVILSRLRRAPSLRGRRRIAEYERELRVLAGVEEPRPQGWYAARHGQRRPAPVLSLVASGRLPYVFGYALVPRSTGPVELAFEQDAEYDHPFRRLLPRFGFGQLGEKVARFRQFNPDSPSTHHDALEFANGRIALLTRLRLGQRATVLQLPARRQIENHPKEPTTADMPAL